MIYFVKIHLGQFGVIADTAPAFLRDLFFVKIGTSQSRSRLSVLPKEIGYPITVLATMEGDKTTEGALHRHFAHIRLQGNRRKQPEWFYPTAELLEFIAKVEAREKSQKILEEALTMP